MVPNLRVRFEFESKGGNNVFLDDINVYGVDSLGNVQSLDEGISSRGLSLDVFPNPSEGQATVAAFWPGSDAELEVRDAAGRLVYQEKLLGNGGRQVALNGLAPGVHFIGLISENQRTVQRLLVLR